MSNDVSHTPVIPVISYTSTAGDDRRKAKVLYDYDAKDATELSLMADEVNLCWLA